MRSMPAANKPSQQKQTETPYIRHKATQKKTKKKKRKGKRKKNKKNMVELKTKSLAQKEAKASELHPWRLELEIFSKSVTLWTPIQRSETRMTAGVLKQDPNT